MRLTADRVCQDKVVAFAGSGDDPMGVLFSKGWLASVCGLAAIEIDLKSHTPFLRGTRGISHTSRNERNSAGC